MSKAHLDRLEDLAYSLVRDGFRDWILNDAIPALRKRSAAQTAVNRRWKDTERKPDHIKAREHRERNARSRERASIREHNAETLAARPELVRLEPIHINSELSAEHESLLKAGWTLHPKDDGTSLLKPPAASPASVPNAPAAIPAAHAQPMAPAPQQTAASAPRDPDRWSPRDFPALRAKAFAALTMEEFQVLERAQSWPKDDQGFINLANKLDWSERRVIERAKACVSSTLKWEAEHPEESSTLDV